MHAYTNALSKPTKSTVITAALAILGLYFGFPNEVVHLPIMAIGYPLALYHLAVSDKEKGLATTFRVAWLISIMAVSICLYWVAIPVHNVGGLPWILAIPCTLAIGTFIALFGALFAVIIRATKDIFPSTPSGFKAKGVFAGLVWCLLEYARNVALSGFPWLSLSAAFVPWPVVTQTASIVGTYALSGLMVMATSLYYEAFAHRTDKNICVASGRLAANIVTVIFAFGICQLYFADKKDDATTLHGAFIQGNIDQNQKWSEGYQDATVRQYMDLSLEALTPPPPTLAEGKTFTKPSLLIWPETSMPFYLQDEKDYVATFQAFAEEHDVALLIGTLAYAYHTQAQIAAGPDKQPYDIYNRAYLINPQDTKPKALNPVANMPFYDKEHLVPFGEFVPSWLKLPFLEGLLQGVGVFTAGGQGAAYGDGVKNASFANGPQPIMVQDLALGMLICYESIFPELAQNRVANGATVLINISNDTWFGNTSAPEQHLQLSAMRAIEQGRYLVRGTNSGISAVIDDLGRMVNQGPLFRATSIDFVAEERTGYTVYHRIAPYMPWLVLVLTIFILAVYAIPIKHRKP